MNLMTHTLLLTYYMTGNAKYFEPIRSMAEIRLRYLSAPPEKPPAEGTESWCASRLGGLTSVITKYRFLTGSKEFDEFLKKQTSPYMQFKLHGDNSALVSALRRNAEALRINFDGYTNEVRYTDRVLRFPSLFGNNGILGEALGTIHSPDPSLLYSTVTGDPGDAGYFPLNAVRWLTPPRDIAALVTESKRSLFTAELFHFGTDQRPMAAELYLLDPGEYEFSLTSQEADSANPHARYDFTVKGRKTRVSFPLPPKTLCTLRIQRRQSDMKKGR
jgi:hypothetical protein